MSAGPCGTPEEDEDADGPIEKMTMGERPSDQDAKGQGELYRDAMPRRAQERGTRKGDGAT